ncbi:MAG TPA: hypothetical protein VHZ24_11760 [Pirellulales bacterium]|nr:hypothetical protein [Pirellulales bacterium]
MQGLVAHEGIIQHKQGLRRNGRLVAHRSDAIGVGSVKQSQYIGKNIADGRQVKTATARLPVIGIIRGDVVGVHCVGPLSLFPQVFGRVVAAHGPIELAADQQQGVMQFLGLEPAPWHGCQQTIARINQQGLGTGRAGHLVSARQHEQAVQSFERPAFGDAPRRQPIQQLRVRGYLAARAEVVARRDNPCAEMPLPEPIDQYPRGQRVFLGDNPASQLQPPALILGQARLVVAR